MLALATAILAGLAFRKQPREVAILAEQSKREVRERRIGQASQVFIWTETTKEPVFEGDQRDITPTGAIVTYLKNTSQQPRRAEISVIRRPGAAVLSANLTGQPQPAGRPKPSRWRG